MRYCFFIITLSWVQPGLAQRIRVSMDYGYATVTGSQAKRIVLSTGVRTVLDCRIAKNTFFSFGGGGYALQGSYNLLDTNHYEKRFYIQVPLSVEKYYPFSARSAGYISAGLYVSGNLSVNSNYWVNGFTNATRQKQVGWNAGISFGAGFTTAITSRSTFGVGLGAEKDLLRKYRQPEWSVSSDKTSLVIFFYRKLRV